MGQCGSAPPPAVCRNTDYRRSVLARRTMPSRLRRWNQRIPFSTSRFHDRSARLPAAGVSSWPTQSPSATQAVGRAPTTASSFSVRPLSHRWARAGRSVHRFKAPARPEPPGRARPCSTKTTTTAAWPACFQPLSHMDRDAAPLLRWTSCRALGQRPACLRKIADRPLTLSVAEMASLADDIRHHVYGTISRRAATSWTRTITAFKSSSPRVERLIGHNRDVGHDQGAVAKVQAALDALAVTDAFDEHRRADGGRRPRRHLDRRSSRSRSTPRR